VAYICRICLCRGGYITGLAGFDKTRKQVAGRMSILDCWVNRFLYLHALSILPSHHDERTSCSTARLALLFLVEFRFLWIFYQGKCINRRFGLGGFITQAAINEARSKFLTAYNDLEEFFITKGDALCPNLEPSAPRAAQRSPANPG
jgi:hypothetical protein